MPARREAGEGRQSTGEPTAGAGAKRQISVTSPSRGRHLMVGRGRQERMEFPLKRLVWVGCPPVPEAQRVRAINRIGTYLRYVESYFSPEAAQPGTG
jgi:hypothetical protein